MKDIAIRAIKTFWQAAAGAAVIALGAGIDLTDRNAVIGVLIAIASAGFSATWNAVSAAFKQEDDDHGE